MSFLQVTFVIFNQVKSIFFLYTVCIKKTKAGFPLDGIFRAERNGYCLNNRLYAIKNAVTPRGKIEMSSTFPWRNRPQANQIASNNEMLNNEAKQ